MVKEPYSCLDISIKPLLPRFITDGLTLRLESFKVLQKNMNSLIKFEFSDFVDVGMSTIRRHACFNDILQKVQCGQWWDTTKAHLTSWGNTPIPLIKGEVLMFSLIFRKDIYKATYIMLSLSLSLSGQG